MNIPECEIGLIGGSSTLSIDMPEALGLDYVSVEKRGLIFNTPFGNSPEFKLFTVHGGKQDRRVLACRMHGWRQGVNRADASRQVFWVFKNAGIKRVLAEGGVGAINHLLNLRDVIIPHDYIDCSVRKDVGLEDRCLLIMRDAICPEMRHLIAAICNENWDGRVYDRGIYVNTDGRHFESPSEINFYRIGGADVVGQSICPEVYLAREIGACYAGLYIVVNYAEGVVAPWQHKDLRDIFYTESCALGRMLIEVIRQLKPVPECNCVNLRKETLLKGIY